MSDIGLLVSARFPYTDGSGAKTRPGLVIGEYLRDYLLAPVSKEVLKYGNEPMSVILDNDGLASGRLKHPSVVRSHKTLWVEKVMCQRRGRVKNRVVDKILRLNQFFSVRNYYQFAHAPSPFVAGTSRIPYAGRVYDEKEMINLVDASLDFWLTAGRYADRFEKAFADFLGVKYCSLTNSGSSANLLAFMALTSPKLGDRRIKSGDEVITVAAGFPTTVAPIIQYGAVPVFVDVRLPDANVDPGLLEHALTARTKAIILAHTLGFPFEVKAVKDFCDRHGLWLIEDNCDALGSRYSMDGEWVYTGTIGHLGTSSFYPPHHITMGEGGAVYTTDLELKRIVESFRDWGRDCWCPPGNDNSCGHRFDRQFGSLPFGYDHKYVYSHFGYNLKVTDMQAAIGCVQLEKLKTFTDRRKANYQRLHDALKDLGSVFHLPKIAPDTDPSPFGFLITRKDEADFTRNDITAHLEQHNIQTRNLFAGNLTCHPCFDHLAAGKDYRLIGELENTDKIMNDSFWIGVYPGMKEPMLRYMADAIKAFVGF